MTCKYYGSLLTLAMMNSIYFTEWPTCSRENESSLSVRYAQVRCIFSSLFVSRTALKAVFTFVKKVKKKTRTRSRCLKIIENFYKAMIQIRNVLFTVCHNLRNCLVSNQKCGLETCIFIQTTPANFVLLILNIYYIF